MNIENENENENENSVFPSFSSLLCNFGNNDVQLQLQMANPELSFPASINASSILDCPIPGLFSTAAATTTTTTTSMEENVSPKRLSKVSVPQTQSGSVHEVATMEQSTRNVKRRKAMNSGEQCHHHRPQSKKPSVTHEKPVCDLQAPVRRSQRLGDRIATLQKLVSPFGKTDTASVLHEAYVNIKLLQEQVQMLSSPYFRTNLYCTQGIGARGDDLRSRGLCLVPTPFTQNLNTEERTERPLDKRF